MPKRVYFLYMKQAPKQFNQLGVFSACLILLFSTLLVTTNAFGANDVVLTTDQTTITLTNDAPVEIKVYPSDLSTLGSKYEQLYFNSTLGGTASDTIGFSASTSSATSTYYVVKIFAKKPIKNGTYPLAIQQYFSQKLNLSIVVNFKPEDIGVKLTTDQTTITFTDRNPIKFKVYPSDLSTINGVRTEYLYFNNSLDIFNTEGYRVQSDGQNGSYYTVSVVPADPIKNGTYSLAIQQLNSKVLYMTIVINIDVKAQGLYATTFDFECNVPNFNESAKCTITPQIDGAGRNLASGKYNVSYSYRTKGSSSWIKQKNFDWDIKEGVISTFIKVVKPLEVKGSASFEGQRTDFSSVIYPRAKLNVTSTNAATVGQNFYLFVSSIKQYSATCSVNNSIPLNIKNGFGKALIYGRTPGNLNLYVTCQSPNWANSYGTRFVYIRQ